MVKVFSQITIFLIILFSFSFRVSSQVLTSVCMRSGVYLSKLTWDYKSVFNKMETDNLVGLNQTFFVELINHKNFNIVPNIGLLQKGGKKEFQFTDAYGNNTKKEMVKYRLNYLTVNTLFKGKLNFGKVHPYLILGPRVDLIVSVSDLLEPIKNDMNKQSYGAVYGSGIDVTFNKISALIEFQGNYNMNNIYHHDKTASNTGLDIYGSTYIINFGIRYNFKTE